MTTELFHVIQITIGTIGFIVATLLFSRSRPWKTLDGLMVFTVLAIFASVLTLVVGSYFLGDYSYREPVRHAVYTLVMLDGILTPVGIVVLQRRGKKRDRLRRLANDAREVARDS